MGRRTRQRARAERVGGAVRAAYVWRRWIWRPVAVAAVALCVGWPVAGPAARPVVEIAAVVLALAAAVVAVLVHRPRRRRTWWLLVVALSATLLQWLLEASVVRSPAHASGVVEIALFLIAALAGLGHVGGFVRVRLPSARGSRALGDVVAVGVAVVGTLLLAGAPVGVASWVVSVPTVLMLLAAVAVIRILVVDLASTLAAWTTFAAVVLASGGGLALVTERAGPAVLSGGTAAWLFVAAMSVHAVGVAHPSMGALTDPLGRPSQHLPTARVIILLAALVLPVVAVAVTGGAGDSVVAAGVLQVPIAWRLWTVDVDRRRGVAAAASIQRLLRAFGRGVDFIDLLHLTVREVAGQPGVRRCAVYRDRRPPRPWAAHPDPAAADVLAVDRAAIRARRGAGPEGSALAVAVPNVRTPAAIVAHRDRGHWRYWERDYLVGVAALLFDAMNSRDDQRESRNDTLTRLPQRDAMSEHLHEITRSARRRTTAVLFVDVDAFKTINDCFGHAAGDEVLVAIARRLHTFVEARVAGPPSDGAGARRGAYRLAGDEFVAVVPVTGAAEGERLAADLRRAVACPVTLDDGRTVTVSASVGSTVTGPGDDRAAHELLRAADTAMYGFKRSRRPALSCPHDVAGERRHPARTHGA